MFVRSKLDRRFAQFCRTGDPDALGYVFDQAAGRLLRVALWLSRQRADAEDLLQRTFVQAIALRERFEPGRPVLPWLMGLMANQAHLLRRERQRREDAVPRVDRVVDPEAEAVAHELQDAVRAVRAKLSAPYRDVLELHLEQGLDAGEIAARLGRSAGTVRTQLVRALDMLRKRLPSGFVAGFAPLAMGGGGLGAVRGVVVEAARRGHVAATSSTVTVAVGIGGLLMAKKLLVVVPVLAVLLGVAAQQVWSRQTRKEPAAPVTPGPIVAAVDAPRPTEEPTAVPPLDRRDVTPGPAPAKASFDPTPVRVPPWDARMLVVDEEDRPVADATITIWTPKKLPADPREPINGNRDYRYSDRTGDPVHVLHTEADGRTTLQIEVECLLAVASKAGFLHTRETWLGCNSDAGRAPRFVLQVPLELHGVVLRADGLPVRGACVRASASTLVRIDGQDPSDPDPVTTDAEGRFTMQVCDQARYTMHAELDAERTFVETIRIRDRSTPQVVLAFPGAITIAGLVVDADGKPVADAGVMAWREYSADGPSAVDRDTESVGTDADGSGHFSVAVMRCARYQLIAHKQGHANSAPLWVETSAERPHALAQLQLQTPGSIRGIVLHGDGSPFAGVQVDAKAETGPPLSEPAMPEQRSLFGEVSPTTTGEDGSFALVVHPGTTWTVRAWTGPAGQRLHFEAAGVAAGRSDVTIRIGDEAVAGCTVHGTVVRSDGEAIGCFRVALLDPKELASLPRGMPPIGRELAAQIDGAHFTVGPLPLGQQFCLQVFPRDRPERLSSNTGPMAPGMVGPFATDRPEIELTVHLERWGEVQVRVLNADGSAAQGVMVGVLSKTVMEAGGRKLVDVDGRAVLPRCAPGPSHFFGVPMKVARTGEAPVVLFDREMTVLSGLNSEVTVQLPAEPAAKDH